MSDDLERPLPGTHDDVFIYEFYKTIGVYYENPNNNILGSDFFFYDYEDCQGKFLDGLQHLQDQKYIELKSRNQNELSNEDLRNVSIRGVPGISRMMLESDMLMEMYEAWMTSLAASRTKPFPEIVDPEGIDPNAFAGGYQYKRINRFRQGYGGIIGGFDILDIQIPLLKQTINMVTGKDIKNGKPTDLDKKLERHPLAHFPPLYPFNYLEDVVFYDPANLGISFAKLQTQYGPIIAPQMMTAFNRHGRKITYADIIKPFGTMGYGVSIDFRPFGFNSFSVQPWWEYYTYRTFYLDEIWNRHGGVEWECTRRKLNNHECASQGQTVREYHVYDPYNDESDLLKWVFRVRDSWIHYWMKGGAIPLENQINLLMSTKEKDIKPFFPIYIHHPGNEDMMKQVALKITSLVVTAIITYYTGGGFAAFMSAISAAAQVIVPKFLNKFGVSAKSQMAINMVYSMALNQYKDVNDKNVKADQAMKFIMTSIDADIQEFRDRQLDVTDIKNLLMSYDDEATDRQKMTLELLARSRSARLNDHMINNGSTTQDEMNNQVNIDKEGMFKIDRLRRIGAGDDVLKFGAIALAGILAYNYFNK